MGQKSRNKRAKHPKRNKINLLSNLSWNTKPSNLQITSKQKDAKCKEYDCEIHKLVGLVADIATGVWRIKKKFSAVKIDDLPDEIKKAYRHVESTWDAIYSAKVEVRDYENEKYIPSRDVKSIAFQPSSSVHIETITETIKPSIFYNNKLIQMGEVIVATPDTIELEKNSNIENTSDNKGRNQK